MIDPKVLEAWIPKAGEPGTFFGVDRSADAVRFTKPMEEDPLVEYLLDAEEVALIEAHRAEQKHNWVSQRAANHGDWKVVCSSCGLVGIEALPNAITHVEAALIPQSRCRGRR